MRFLGKHTGFQFTTRDFIGGMAPMQGWGVRKYEEKVTKDVRVSSKLKSWGSFDALFSRDLNYKPEW